MVLELLHQLDGSAFASGNCGCVATAHAIAWATGNKVHPRPRACRLALDGIWVGQQSDPPNNATSLADQSRAWESFRSVARKRRLKLPRFDIQQLTPWKKVIEALESGHAVMLQIDNETLNKRARRLSGFPTFDGLHVILLTELRRRAGGRVELLDYDGGYDGRISGGIRVPDGPQWVPADVLREAAEQKNVCTLMAHGSSAADARARAAGTATFAIIRKATKIDDGRPHDDDDGLDDDESDDDGVVGAGGSRDDDHAAGNGVAGDGAAVEVATTPVATSQIDSASPEALRGALKVARRKLAAARVENERLTDQVTSLRIAMGIIRTLLAEAHEAPAALDEAAAEIDGALPPPPTSTDIVIEDGVGDEL